MTKQPKSFEKEKKEKVETAARNYGIDLLKVLSMFMIVILHVTVQGGVMKNASGIGLIATQVLCAIVACAVNLFGMTTGYLMFNRKIKYSRIVGIWLQVVFYGVLLNLIMKFIFEESIAKSDWFGAILPITFRSWWYVSAYFLLFFLIPYLNRMLATLSHKQGLILGGVLLALFCGISFLSPTDVAGISNGMSLIWLCVLYIWGALIKKYENQISVKPRWFALGWLLTICLAMLSKPIVAVASKITGFSISESLFTEWNSVIVVAMAMMLMLFCLKVKLPHWLGKAMGWIAPLSFAVYIIHEHPVACKQIMNSKYVFLAEQNVLVMILGILGCAVLIFVGCVLIEWGRVWLFKLLRINKLTDKLGGWMNAKLLPEETTAQSSKE